MEEYQRMNGFGKEKKFVTSTGFDGIEIH